MGEELKPWFQVNGPDALHHSMLYRGFGIKEVPVESFAVSLEEQDGKPHAVATGWIRFWLPRSLSLEEAMAEVNESVRVEVLPTTGEVVWDYSAGDCVTRWTHMMSVVAG